MEVKLDYTTCRKCGGLFDYTVEPNLLQTENYFGDYSYYYKCPYCGEEDSHHD